MVKVRKSGRKGVRAMKIRIMGTKDECLIAMEYYRSLFDNKSVRAVSISDLYPNRNSNLYRLYIDIEYYI